MFTRLFPAVALALCALVAGCSHHALAPATPVDLTIVLAPGQTSSVEGTDLRVGFVGIASDSRCPADAMCVWAGEGVVAVQVVDRSGNRQYQLSTAPSKGSAEHGAYVLTLNDLSPYPFVSQPIAPGAYRVTLRIATR
jgi:hypothetical protein